MKYRRIIAAALAVFTLFTGATALAAGTAADPLVTKSHLEDVFNKPLEEYIETVFDTLQASFEAKTQGLQAAADAYARKQVAAAYGENADLVAAIQARVAELTAADQTTLTKGMAQRTLKKGDVVTGPAGASVMFVTGEGKVVGPAGSEIINITAGSTRQPGPAIRTGILYMMTADNGSGIEVTSETATILLKDGARGGYELQYEPYAQALNHLGLFRGSDKGYELERTPNRQEALVMLIRLLGEEQAALAFDPVSPFNDLTNWVDGQRYIAYAYRMRYTNGMSIDLPANFNSPYKALTITEFWQRWHMTLTRFLTKYIYIPLGGNRRGTLRTYGNILMVFLVSGLWHGDSWTFVLWGLLHGLFSVLTRLGKPVFDRLPKVLNWLLTFCFVNITWVLFRAESLADAFHIIRQLFAMDFGPLSQSLSAVFLLPEFALLFGSIPFLASWEIWPTLWALIAYGFAMVLLLWCRNAQERMVSFRPGLKNMLGTYALLVWCILSLSGVSTFLYFNF